MTAPRAVVANLTEAMRRRFGTAAHLENVTTPTLGGSNRTIVFDLVDGATRRRLVSREETYRATDSPFLHPSEQFRLTRFLFDHRFPVPEPLFEFDRRDSTTAGYVCAFIEGQTMPKAVLHSPDFKLVRPLLASQFGELLARLHRLPFEELPFLVSRSDSLDPISAQRARFDSYGGDRPAIEMGLRWLELHRPPPADRKLLHGDFRVGNLMIDTMGVTAVLDWECSHIGSPLEDIGWLCTRSWRFDRPDLMVGGVSALQPLVDAYLNESGQPLDPEAIHYWTVFGLVRWAILNLMQAAGHMNGSRRGLVYAACGRNVSLIEYDLLMTLSGHYS